MTRIKKLTPEQEALMAVVRGDWLDSIFKNDQPMNEAAAKSGVAFLYGLAKLKQPRVIVCESPMACQLAVYDQIRGHVSDQASDQVRDQIHNQVYDQTYEQIRGRVSNQVHEQIYKQVRGQVHDQVSPQVKERVYSQVRDPIYTQVCEQVRDQVTIKLANRSANKN